MREFAFNKSVSPGAMPILIPHTFNITGILYVCAMVSAVLAPAKILSFFVMLIEHGVLFFGILYL